MIATPSLFQFTHPGGVRLAMNCMASSARVFQFTHPGGVRRLNRKHSTERASSFNSRTREGCDQINVDKSTTDLQFQFTHPGGVRLRGNILPALLRVCFNSRTREGGDYSAQLSAYRARVSIHAPGRGATIVLIPSASWLISFNSRTREGCDYDFYRRQDYEGSFQFTHPGGVRLMTASTYSPSSKFQFTHPGGVRRNTRW